MNAPLPSSVTPPAAARSVVSGMTKMTPSEAFVETMVAQGVDTMFGIMGSAFMDAMDIFAPAGIRLIPVVHEQGAGHMADGYARASGRHGVVIGQNGPGISNCVTAIAAAYWAHSPVVLITPETGTMGQGLGGFQEANQLPMFQEFTKYQGHVNNNKRMAEYTARCFDRAHSELGPTQLNIPRDLFYGEITCEIPKPMRLDRGPGGDDSLNAAAELLATAKFPVLISGGGVVMSGGMDACIALAERLCGRGIDGAPLAGLDHDGNGGFGFAGDGDGRLCPVGSHIRRANPRTGDDPKGNRGWLCNLIATLGFSGTARADAAASARFHRILRRGRPYGRARTAAESLTALDRKGESDAEGEGEAGLYFIGLNASLARQFEFIQGAWLNSPAFAGLSGEQDPLLGHRQPFPAGSPVAH